MPKPATIEDAPHQLKLLSDYGKTAITISLALLSLSVAFAEKFVKSPLDNIQAALLFLLWLSLASVLIAGLRIVAHVNSVCSFYMTAFRIVYPDALELVGSGYKIKSNDPDEIQLLGKPNRDYLNEVYATSTLHLKKAYWWANCSFWMLGLSSGLVVFIGFYSSIYLGMKTNASSAIESALGFVPKHYKIPGTVAEFDSLLYDDIGKTYTVTVRNKQTVTLKYEVTVDSTSGNITKVNLKP